MEGGPNGGAQPHAGADVAGDRWSVKHHVEARRCDDVYD
jgi:hypothetical protein